MKKFSNLRIKNCVGFTLIELVIVISVLAIIMITVTNIMVNSFRARSRVDIGDKLEQNGNAALAEIRSNMLGSDGKNVSCTGNSITFVNNQDGMETTLSCIEGGKIASKSAGISRWETGSDVIVKDCGTFVGCEVLPAEPEIMSVANFKFVLATSVNLTVGIAETVARSFETKVVIRQ